MSYLTKEQLMEAVKNAPKLTPEEKAKMKELGEKLKATSYEERRATRLKLDEEDGYC